MPERQVPWKVSNEDNEPSSDLATGTSQSSALIRRKKPRESPIRPSERRRRKRQMSVTFSDSAIKDRIIALTERWNIVGPDGRRPAYSTVVEYLLLPRLEAAERGEISPPED
jgi:hypothetical protein